jgi:small conductance mechanosensitive channel
MTNSLQSIDQVKASALDMAVRFGPKLLTAIVIFVVGYFVGGWVGGMVDRLLLRLKLEEPVRLLLVRMTRVLVLALFAIVALQNLGIELLPLVAGLGVAGAGIALAMQGILGNVAAGLTILFTRPFHVGDYISIAQEEGGGAGHQPLQHDPGAHRPLEGGDPQPQDRRGDPAQLRPDQAAGPECKHYASR